MTKKSIVLPQIIQALAAWIATILSYTLFNYALVIASGTLTASASMNFLGGLLRLPELLTAHKKNKVKLLVALGGGICLPMIAAPLWISYQISGGSGIVLNIVYDTMLVIVCLLGPFLGIIPKPGKKGLLFICGIAVMAVLRSVYHHNEIHWSLWLIVLVAFITIGYIGFNMAVKQSHNSVLTQIVMNCIGGSILLLFSIGVWISNTFFGLRCSISCNAWNFPITTDIGIVLGGIAIYCIIHFLAILYAMLDMRNLKPIRLNISGFTMPFVYEGLVVFGSPALSFILHKQVSYIDILISIVMLCLVAGDVWFHIKDQKQ